MNEGQNLQVYEAASYFSGHFTDASSYPIPHCGNDGFRSSAFWFSWASLEEQVISTANTGEAAELCYYAVLQLDRLRDLGWVET
ncbi:hypothetical protein LB503_009021 [Fusarium chuoi]|nr:hypothetical protein LB503_009021 [Fusarium chuoi]